MVDSRDPGVSERFKDIYERYCNEIDKLDEALNVRTNWLLAAQSILFASVGISGEGPGKIMVEVVPWVGIFLSMTILTSIMEIFLRHMRYRARLAILTPLDNSDSTFYPLFFRRAHSILLSYLAPTIFPVIFGLGWCFFLILQMKQC